MQGIHTEIHHCVGMKNTVSLLVESKNKKLVNAEWFTTYVRIYVSTYIMYNDESDVM